MITQLRAKDQILTQCVSVGGDIITMMGKRIKVKNKKCSMSFSNLQLKLEVAQRRR